MTIEDKGLPVRNATRKQAGAQPAQPQQPAFDNGPSGQQAPVQEMWSWHNQGGPMGAPIGVGLGSGYLQKLIEALKDIYKDANSGMEVTLLVLDNAAIPALAFSAIVVCLRLKNEPRAGVAFHVLIVEATGNDIEPIFEQIHGNQVEIIRPASLAYDDDLIRIVNAKVSEAFPTGPYHPVDCTVVPKTFNPEDRGLVHRLALSSGLAAGTELVIKTPGFNDVNIGTMQRDNSLCINLAFNRTQIENSVADPVRSDVLIGLVSQQAGSQKVTSVNRAGRTARISDLSGFVDLVWSPVAGAEFNPYQQIQPTQTQKWAARLVVTSLASNYAMTPSSVLLAILTSLAVRDDNNWIQAFRPSVVSSKELDLHDIGALGIEANLLNDPSGLGAPIATGSDTFRLEDLGRLVAATVRPGLMISLDVPHAGPETWGLSMFSAADGGNQGALELIYRAANELTNGNFQKYFQVNQQMFADSGNQVHLGYYYDKDGLRRDIRDIDYLAVANYAGTRNPQVIRDWSDTITHTPTPLALRMSERKKIIMGITRETAVFTGFATRVTFTADFLQALMQGARDAGFVTRVSTPLNSSEFNNQRMGAGYVGATLLANGQSFAQASQFYGNNNAGYAAPQQYRY